MANENVKRIEDSQSPSTIAFKENNLKPLSEDAGKLQDDYAKKQSQMVDDAKAKVGLGSESATAIQQMDEGGIGKNTDMVSSNKNKTLTLAEQRALAAYAQYSLPKFYIPPLLVTDTGQADDVGKGVRAGFIFTSIGDLKVEDLTFPRNLPILKVPDADIDAVQDMGFGSGSIKVSGRLWGEAGYARLETLRELCKSRRPLIFISQETGAWYVMPQNVPGKNTAADKPYQYFFDVTFVCVAQLNEEDPTVQHYAKLRRELVRKKFNREMALIRAQNSVKERIKNFDTITGAGSGIQKGFYYDATSGNASYNPDLQELQNENFVAKTTGSGGMVNNNGQTIQDSSNWKEQELGKVKDINASAKDINEKHDAAAKSNTQATNSTDKNLGMPSNTNPGGGGRNEQTNKEKNTNTVPIREPKTSTPEERAAAAKKWQETSLKKYNERGKVKVLGGGGGASWE